MPKIRNKPNLFSNGSYRKKSGILTRSLKNIVKKEKSYDRFTLPDYNFSSVSKKVNINPYNDNNTINFVYGNVNPVFCVNDRFKSNNKVLHSPNEFNTTDTVSKLVTRGICSNFILENHEDLDTYSTPFVDNKNKRTDQETTSSHVIPIDLEFSSDCRLSFNKKSSDPSQVSLLGENYNTHNGNVVFFNFEDKNWEYVLDVDKNYFENIDEFLKAPIAFNSLESNKQNKILQSSNATPINTFGFPYEKRFQGMKRHFFPLKHHITDVFVLEGIRVNICNTLKAESTTTDNSSILNSLTFFVINQRSNLNGISFENLEDNTKTIEYYNTSQISTKLINHEIGGVSPSTYNTYTVMTNTGTVSESTQVITGSIDQESITYPEKQSSQRELVAYTNFVNYSSSINTDSVIDKQKIKSDANYYSETIQQPSLSSNFAEIDFVRKSIESYGTVAMPVYNDRLETISQFQIYPSSKFETRSGCIYRSERSLSTVFEPQKNLKTSTDDNNVTLSFGSESKKENGYVLHPSDNLILGFSFDTNKNISHLNTSKLGKDISILHDKVSIELVGRYMRNSKYFSNNRQNYSLKGTVNVLGNTDNIVDSVGMSNIYLNKGAYYDANVYVSLPLPIGGALSIPNIDSGSLFNSNSKSFNNYLKVKNSNEKLVDNDPSSVGGAVFYNSSYLSYLKFGQPKDKLYYFKSSAYRKDKNKVFLVKKLFMTNFLTKKTSTITQNPTRNSTIDYPNPFVE